MQCIRLLSVCVVPLQILDGRPRRHGDEDIFDIAGYEKLGHRHDAARILARRDISSFSQGEKESRRQKLCDGGRSCAVARSRLYIETDSFSGIRTLHTTCSSQSLNWLRPIKKCLDARVVRHADSGARPLQPVAGNMIGVKL